MAKKSTNKEPNIFKRTIEFVKRPNVTFTSGVVVVAFTIYLLLSFLSFFVTGAADHSEIDAASAVAGEVANSAGRSGAIVADYLINDCFGWSSVLLIPMLLVVALRLMNLHSVSLLKWFISVSFGVVWGSLFFSFILGDVITGFVNPGGAHGDFLCGLLMQQIGAGGIILLLVTTFLLFMIYLTRETIVWLRKLLTFSFVRDKKGVEEETDEDDTANDDVQDDDVPQASPEIVLSLSEGDDNDDNADDNEVYPDDTLNEDKIQTDDADTELARRFDEMTAANAAAAEDTEIVMDIEQAKGDDDTGGKMFRPINPRDELSYYKPPTIDLLDKYENTAQSIDMNEQNVKKDEIVRALRDFDIEISSIKATVGPTITLYEITPAPGVRIAKIRNLEDDIAMSLSALCIRIIAPIPGKGTIGIEVPNANKQIVPMASLLNSRKFKETDMALPLALGKTISNEVFMVDMAKMPHLLVAGATGMGKSVGLNAIITSLLYKMHPAYLKFVMVDPKMVELSLYSIIEKHFLAKLEGEDEPIITDVTRVVRTLKSLCTEMDNRYRLLQAAMVRSVKEYNEKFLNKELLPTKGHRFMPYIVVIIDEYGDLMMTAGKEVEMPIARIAQKARAVGIHMIIATQRPTTNIITGTIKANFPARMAFRVISPIDSRTILERTGANQLQGRGDMLFLAGNDPVRVQCALVETKEVERVCKHIAKQQGYESAYILPEPDEATGDTGASSASRGEGLSGGRLDDLFVEAARTVVMHQQGSTSLLQRKFNIGFNRAGRIMDQLCQAGIVGEQDGSKPRQVFCSDEADLEFRLKNILSNNQA